MDHSPLREDADSDSLKKISAATASFQGSFDGMVLEGPSIASEGEVAASRSRRRSSALRCMTTWRVPEIARLDSEACGGGDDAGDEEERGATGSCKRLRCGCG